MTRSEVDGTISFSPERLGTRAAKARAAQRGQRVDEGEVITIALRLGGLGLLGTGLAVGAYIAGVTVLVTLPLIALIWWVSPHVIELSISEHTIEYRRFGRRTSIPRTGRVTAATGILLMNNDITEGYLFVHGREKRFHVPTKRFDDAELSEVIGLLDAIDLGPEPLTARTIDRLHPGLPSSYQLHPWLWTSLIVIGPIAAILIGAVAAALIYG